MRDANRAGRLRHLISLLRPYRGRVLLMLVALLIAPIVVTSADDLATRLVVTIGASVVVAGMIWYSKSQKVDLMLEAPDVADRQPAGTP